MKVLKVSQASIFRRLRVAMGAYLRLYMTPPAFSAKPIAGTLQPHGMG